MVALSEFYISVNDTTKAQWHFVRMWALAHGYTDLAVGEGKAADHPVQTVAWYDVVKWANAASEKQGLTPCYTVDGALYRTGQTDDVICDWRANGYRLPTSAEWEVAARGGLSGKRFPWGDTISQAQANYSEHSVNDSFKIFHPKSRTKFYEDRPFTSPVGSFAANGYGLNDMAGNVWQWCWDWYGPNLTEVDPRGSRTRMGSVGRVLRGGCWENSARGCRFALRNYAAPSTADNRFGFRLARSRP